ncbi:hypothetical protein Sme01_74290 [Sphaerisporangium melleum]|uniref:Uncharacterized protein n=1 Tax=Sphaerisporangium melleum TaxID=321316 RepID=A0A917R4T4_9ACTN|nr:hypothetical protein GCM10007964_33150 [Sphaerisporangium melleum]GII74953.1 hypothetical protein Sme01_74290 [Sphaerisporangium melleum]
MLVAGTGGRSPAEIRTGTPCRAAAWTKIFAGRACNPLREPIVTVFSGISLPRVGGDGANRTGHMAGWTEWTWVSGAEWTDLAEPERRLTGCREPDGRTGRGGDLGRAGSWPGR